MPLEQSLNVSPYYDDYDQLKEFYRILFKPGVAVQTRELNQLQSILQNQVERFGDNVFKSGTILSGCNFHYMPNYSYVKILDVQVNDGEPSDPSSYVNYFVKSDLNLKARVLNYQDGLESQTPDLKTLYLQYVSSSDQDTSNGNVVYTKFAVDQQLTVYSPDYPIFKYNVINGGLGFSNNDTAVIASAITITGNTGAFTNGELLTQATTGAKVEVVGINTTAVADTIILSVKPRTVDLTNNSVNSAAWTLQAGYNVTGNTSSAVGNVATIIGQSAKGLITTDTLGVVQSVTVSSIGKDYSYVPFVTIKTSNTTAVVNTLDIRALNYKAVITVGNSSINSVGTGYAFKVTEGLIYQKGHFLRVDPQTIIVDKYTITPNNVSVGFRTDESYVDYNEDTSLFDNASDTTNYKAPGADRLKLTPVLYKTTISDAAANTNFFPLAEWLDGYAYKENRTTQYTALVKQLEQRSFETSGNFVVNKFNVGSKEIVSNTTHYDVLIDPGLAYINGQRLQTISNQFISVPRASTTGSQQNQVITVNYGSYIKVKNLVGYFNFKVGDVVKLYDTASSYIQSGTIGSGTTISPSGTQIGTARIRSLVIDSGVPGTAECVYRLYVFDITMSDGFSIKNVRSIFNDNAQDGICDPVLEYDITTATNLCKLYDNQTGRMLFPVKQKAVKAITDINYQYRTVTGLTPQLVAATGQVDISVGAGLTFPYGAGLLSSTQKKDFIVVPVANTQASVNIAGSSFALTSGNTTIIGTGSAFGGSVKVGDFLKFSNSSANIISQVTSVASDTQITVRNAPGASMTAANAVLFFPALYPIPLEDRSNRTVTIGANQNTATIYVGTLISPTVNVYVTHNTQKSNASPVSLSVSRDVFVKIHTSNNAGSNTGPWSLGIPGAVRLKKVYLGDASAVNTSSTDVTKYFFIDVGQDEQAYRHSQLVRNKSLSYSLSNNVFLLAQLDVLTTGGSEGFFTIGSYPLNETLSLASSNTTINTLEIPEMVTDADVYYDMRDVIDFRPYAVNTAVITANATLATVNPADTFTLSGDDQFFPVPDSQFTYDIEYYLPRKDVVALDKKNNFIVKQGAASLGKLRVPAVGQDEINIETLNVPQWPSIPQGYGEQTLQFASKLAGNARGIVGKRLKEFSITVDPRAENNVSQPRRYTMEDIGDLANRIEQIEYQSSLNEVEKSVKDKTIPSGITPSTSRYKNGFFVELFQDDSSSDKENSEFACSIDYETGLLKPPVRQVNFESQFDLTDATTAALAAVNPHQIMLPYVEKRLLDQSIKTSIINSDGDKVTFSGHGEITPPSFKISTRLSVVTLPAAKKSAGGTIGGGWAPSGGGGGGGCFLTTATVDYFGFDDNCAELQLARYLRDERMDSKRGKFVKDLYKIVGPVIVERKQDWDDFYTNTVAPVSQLVEQNRFEEAQELYIRSTIMLIDQYASQYNDKDIVAACYDRMTDDSTSRVIEFIRRRMPYAGKYLTIKFGLNLYKAKYAISDSLKALRNVSRSKV